VVADSPLGVRVISVEERSPAHLGDLRAEDIIVRVGEEEVRSIDAFARLSTALRGRAESVPVLVFRGGDPRELTLHLYSYPVLQAWGIAFIPEHDIRFAEPQTGSAYWTRLGAGFEAADKPAEALDAYLNSLHNVPADQAVAFSASRLCLRLSRERLEAGALLDGIESLRRGMVMLERLFSGPLSEAQLATVREELRRALEELRAQTRSP
jgi:hypothetical protein